MAYRRNNVKPLSELILICWDTINVYNQIKKNFIVLYGSTFITLRWRRNGHDGVSNHQHHHCSLNNLFGRRSKKTSKLRVTGLCAGNSPGTAEFRAQKASNAENISIWWHHHDIHLMISAWHHHDIYLIDKVYVSGNCDQPSQQQPHICIRYETNTTNWTGKYFTTLDCQIWYANI